MDPSFDSEQDPSLMSANRRRADRRTSEARITLRVRSEAIEGVTDNLSHIGVLFFTEDPLRVEIEVDEEGALRTFSGRLVRLQRMSERNTGFAVEFDRE
jgi:hypothetical protein